MLTIEGRVALVTGGGRGIGRAISLLLARVGAKVAVNYRINEEAASATVDSIRTAGGTAVALPADVSRPEDAARLVAETEARLGPLDVLVVNHGIWLRVPIDAMTPEQWDEMLRINLGER
jgi:NAD(P)-dependent dehydrogenase (short-subunit alcohol dehydrogenase family)